MPTLDRALEGNNQRTLDYRAYQDALADFPEIPVEDCARAVQFVETDGTVYRAAEAVVRSLGYGRGRRWLGGAYNRVPGFAALTEAAYSMVARHRSIASACTRFLWGEDVRWPTYFAARRGFLKTLGLVYLIAFISVWCQVDGLMGARGIIPAAEILAVPDSGPRRGAMQAPTICWWDSSDTTLHALCFVGAAAAGLLTFGLLPIPALLICFGCYLSLMTPGESSSIISGISCCSKRDLWGCFSRHGSGGCGAEVMATISRTGLFLAKALLFKLMFMSGVVKLTSGDASWLDLTALDYHYWTQPLPTVFAWFADQNPEWLKKICVAGALSVEIVVPFFIWAPRRLAWPRSGRSSHCRWPSL